MQNNFEVSLKTSLVDTESYHYLVNKFLETGKGFDKIYNKLYPGLKHFIFQYTKDASSIDDILATTIYQSYANILKFDFSSEFSTWVFAIAKNNCHDFLRKRRAIEFQSLSIDGTLETHCLDEGFSNKFEPSTLMSRPYTSEDSFDYKNATMSSAKAEHSIQKFMAEVFKKIDRDSINGKILYYRFINGYSNKEILNKLNNKSGSDVPQNKLVSKKSNPLEYTRLLNTQDSAMNKDIYTESFIKNNLIKTLKVLKAHFKNFDMTTVLNANS